MTPHRAAGPGPRTVALHRTVRSAAGLAIALFLSASLLIACGPSSVAPSGIPGSGGPAVPGGGASGGSPGVPDPGPSLPRWPGTTVLAVIALGAADGEFQKAGADLAKAADDQDLKAMWGAADGLARLIDGLMTNLDRLEVYQGTRAIAAVYRQALPEMGAGAKQLRDAITAGDSEGITAGYLRILKGTKLYGPIRQEIGGLVEQALVQQRLLLR